MISYHSLQFFPINPLLLYIFLSSTSSYSLHPLILCIPLFPFLHPLIPVQSYLCVCILLWRAVSNIKIEAATAAFKDSTFPAMGIRI